MDIVDSEKNEAVPLIQNEIGANPSHNGSANCVDTGQVKKNLSLKEAFYIMIGFSIGPNILVMPFVIRQLGLVASIISIVGVTFLLTVCTYVLWLCVQSMLEESAGTDVTRDAYPSVAEFSCGRKVRLLAVISLVTTALSTCIVFFLLSASIIADLVPIGSLTHENTIRVWTIVIVALLTPVTYLGNYSDVKIPALVALATALITGLAVLVNCLLYVYAIPGKLDVSQHESETQIFFIPLGTIIFAMTGTNFTIANITVIAASPQKLVKPIIACNSVLIVIILATGVIPYLIFGENTLSSTTSTFYQVIIDQHGGTGDVFRVITILIQVLILIHITMASILDINPIFLYIEDILKVAHEFNIKRVLIRTSCMLLMLAICLLVPQFEFAIGIAGGVPFTFMCVFLPVVFYTKLFNLSIYKKVFVCIFLLVVIVFMLGNFISSIFSLRNS